MLHLLLCLLLLTPAGAAPAAGDIYCEDAHAKGLPYRVCTEPGTKANPDLLYFFHGLGGSADTWATSALRHALRAEWNAATEGAPTVITISFGAQWMLSDLAAPAGHALLPLLLEEILPPLERTRGFAGGRRLLLGQSMGGYNAALLALRYPERFARAATLCPAILPFGFDVSEAEIEAYRRQSSPRVERAKLDFAVRTVRGTFQTRANWERHDPLTLARTAAAPPFFVSASYDDEFGFFGGALALRDTLLARGAEVRWAPGERGGHCHEAPGTAARLARFLGGAGD